MAIDPIQNLQPSQVKGLYAGNYIDFTASTFEQWGQQFLPDVYEKETEIYGNRTIGGFLKMVSAEMPMSSDQVIWTEQGRLHTRYVNLGYSSATLSATRIARSASDAIGDSADVAAGTALNFQLLTGLEQPGGASTDVINFRVGQTVMLARHTTVDSSAGDTIKGVITAVAAAGFTVSTYEVWATDAARTGGATGALYTALVYGSEFAKGTGNFEETLSPEYSTYSNAPIIMKEHYGIFGSDTTQIGWIEVASENGASGYLWYVKAEHENRLRWEDYQEMTMLEAVQNDDATPVALGLFRADNNDVGGPASGDRGARGTEGLFSALQDRGNVYSDLIGDLDDTPKNALADFDTILTTLDKNGAIEENMIYTNRQLSLAIDNFGAGLSDYNSNGGGASWGVFNNSKEMGLELGFSSFRRGSYDFYKSDWKYLNDQATRGGFSDIEGVLVPAGTSTVYDQQLGKNIKRPFLHVRYRASETENRKNKSWITGSVGGAYTTDIDELRMHYLTERCLVTQGANNFVLFTS